MRRRRRIRDKGDKSEKQRKHGGHEIKAATEAGAKERKQGQRIVITEASVQQKPPQRQKRKASAIQRTPSS